MVSPIRRRHSASWRSVALSMPPARRTPTGVAPPAVLLRREPVLDQPPGDAVGARQLEAVRLAVAHFLAGEPAGVLQFHRVDGDLLAQPLGVEAQHDVGRERPGLAGVVAYGAEG